MYGEDIVTKFERDVVDKTYIAYEHKVSGVDDGGFEIHYYYDNGQIKI